jgi:hypothetical protein
VTDGATAAVSTRVAIVMRTGAHAGIAVIVTSVVRVAIAAAGAAVEAVIAIVTEAVTRIDVSVRRSVVMRATFAARARCVGAREIALTATAVMRTAGTPTGLMRTAAMPIGWTPPGQTPIGRVTSADPRM